MKEVEELNEILHELVAMPDSQVKIKSAVSKIMAAQKKVTDKHKNVHQITSLLVERRDAQASAIEAQQDLEGRELDSQVVEEEDYPLPGSDNDEESLQEEEKEEEKEGAGGQRGEPK